MDTVSLYRKYRPHNFDNLVGQDHIKTILINALKSGNIPHAYLFTGPRGTGKTSTARLIAKAINCQNIKNEFNPCNECDFCSAISSGQFIDLIEIDAASNRGIDEVRDLKEKINFSPTLAKYKIYIIDEVHMMTKEAFNALLKTLEEPPDHAYFILATTEAHKLPETIVSRCQRFNFSRISEDALITRLNHIAQTEGIEVEVPALKSISKYVDGGLRDAIGLMQQLTYNNKLTFENVKSVLGVSDSTLLEKLLEFVLEKDTSQSLAIVHELHDQGSDLKQFIHEFVNLLRNKMLDSVANENKELTGRFLDMIDIFQTASMKLDGTIPQLSLEMAIVEVCGAFVKENKEIPADVDSPPVAEVPTPTKSPIQERSHKPIENKTPERVDLNTVNFQEKWPRIVERIKTPALRMSLKSGSPIKIEGQQAHICFSTTFHKEKIMESDNRAELEKIMEEFFGVGVKIVPEVKPLDLKPMVEDKVPDPSPPEGVDPVDKALNIFGGELTN